MSKSQSESGLAAVADSDRHRRDNWFGDVEAGDDETATGHEEIDGTDPAEYLAFQLLSRFVEPVCARTGIPLSDPEFYLPKQREHAHGFEEYRQHRHRRRINPETGYINWGESTATGLPEIDHEQYRLAVDTFLAEREVRVTALEEYDQLAERFWHDPQYNSHGALEQFIRAVRERKQD